MRTYDFSPLYRSTIGFDRLFDMLDQTRRRICAELAALQHRADQRRRLPHHHGSRGFRPG